MTQTVNAKTAAPTIAGLSPHGVPAATSAPVMITRSSFVNVSAVSFGSALATTFAVVGPSQIMAIAPPQAAGTVPVRVTTAAGTTPSTTANRFTYLAPGQQLAAPVVTVNASQPTVVLGGSAPATVIVVLSTVTTATIDASALVTTTATSASAVLPGSVGASVETTIGTVTLQLPAGTAISATAAWPGTIRLPTVTENSNTTLAIEVGFGDVRLSLNRAGRLVFPGKANQTVGYRQAGVLTPITVACALDDQSTVDAQLPADGDCKSNAANELDLVVWTKHFTEFATQRPSSPTASPPATATTAGGGGGAPPPSSTPTPCPAAGCPTSMPIGGQGGQLVSRDRRVSLDVPAGTVDQSATITFTYAPITIDPPVGQHALMAFALSAKDAQGSPVAHFTRPLTLRISYLGLEPASAASASVQLYRQDGAGAWTLVPATSRDVANRALTVSVREPGRFAALAPSAAPGRPGAGGRTIFLPAVARGFANEAASLTRIDGAEGARMTANGELTSRGQPVAETWLGRWVRWFWDLPERVVTTLRGA